MVPHVAIVGCGLIGQKRAKTLGGAKLVACADIVGARAESLAKPHGALATSDWREAIRREDVSLVIVATTNNLLAEITIEALQS